jgi:hypothetical protein
MATADRDLALFFGDFIEGGWAMNIPDTSNFDRANYIQL